MARTQTPTNFIKHTSNNPLQKFLINNFYASLILIVRDINPRKILDVGAGEGFTLNKLKENQLGKELEGIEYTKEAIALGKKMFPRIKIKQGTAYELPYQDESFDLVISTEVLEHLTDPQKALKEMSRVGKKYLLLTVPNEPWFTIQRVLRGKNLLHLGAHPEHIQHWTPGAFKKFLTGNGLKIDKVRLPFAWTMILAEKKSPKS